MRTTKDVLAEICRHPERDDLRLDYAAACEAKDPEYAQYIRTEVAWWARPVGSRGLQKGSERVEQRISHAFKPYCYSVKMYRGFVEQVTMDPYVFIDHGDKLLDLAPIRHITFTPKPLPPDLERPHPRLVVPSAVPEVMACPHLSRVYSFSFGESNYQVWQLQESDIEAVLASRYLDRIVTFWLPGGRAQYNWDEAYCAGVWSRAFERPEFRRMLDVDFPRYPGEYSRDFDDDWERVTETLPMGAQGRALEQKHGYLPSLHVVNRWGTDPTDLASNDELVLGVLRGELPKYPVGAPVTEVMYALPPPKRRTTGNNW